MFSSKKHYWPIPTRNYGLPFRMKTAGQEDHIELIVVENYTSPAVMEAQGSKLTTSTPKAIPANVTMGVASLSMWLSNWR